MQVISAVDDWCPFCKRLVCFKVEDGMIVAELCPHGCFNDVLDRPIPVRKSNNATRQTPK